MPRTFEDRDAARLERAAREYNDLKDKGRARYALSGAFDHQGFRIEDYCDGFGPNPAARVAESAVKAWAQDFGMWLPGVTEHCNDLASYLYPEATVTRLISIGKNFAIDWYLNDTIGRERVAGLTPAGRQAAEQARERLIAVSQTLAAPQGASSADLACLDMLREVRASSPPGWYGFFSGSWVRNLQTMCRDGNASTSGTVPTVTEYIHARTYISGMQHTIALCEFARDAYLDWATLQRDALAATVHRLWWLCAAIGCLSNDLFSFEKEFIGHRSDSNIILVSILNAELTLHDAIIRVIRRVRAYTGEYLELSRILLAEAQQLAEPARGPLSVFIRSTQSCVKATWAWQVSSKRYKSPGSIFEETRTSDQDH